MTSPHPSISRIQFEEEKTHAKRSHVTWKYACVLERWVHKKEIRLTCLGHRSRCTKTCTGYSWRGKQRPIFLLRKKKSLRLLHWTMHHTFSPPKSSLNGEHFTHLRLLWRPCLALKKKNAKVLSVAEQTSQRRLWLKYWQLLIAWQRQVAYIIKIPPAVFKCWTFHSLVTVSRRGLAVRR